MNITILSFKVLKEIPDKTKTKKRSLFKRKNKDKNNYYLISLDYNIDEDRFYYRDEVKNIPTKKDLSRSIILLYDIYKRYEKFNLSDCFKLKENNLKLFLDNFLDGNNGESDFYYKKMLFGSQSVNLQAINFICNQLGIDDIDFNNYFYINYNPSKFY